MKSVAETNSSGKRKLSETEIEAKEITREDGRDSNSLFSVAIVGGGIAGLGAALALQQKGFRVSVFERDSLFEDRRQGYGLTLTNNPKGPLADLNLLDECIARDCPSNAHWIFAPEGNVLGYYGRSFKTKTKKANDSCVSSSGDNCQNATVEGRGNLRIPRQNLRKMMLDRLNPGTVRWGMKLLDYTESSNCVTAQFQHENSECSEASEQTFESHDLNSVNRTKAIEEISVDILVGADGIRSVVRQLRSQKVGVLGNNKLISESSPLHYVGVAVILGITSATHPLINQQGFYCLDGTNRLFTMPFEDGGLTPHVSASSGTLSEFISEGVHPASMQEASSESKDSVAAKSGDNCGNLKSHDEKISNTRLTMWQLSFSDFSEEEGARLRTASPEELLNEALRRCEGWFEPVCDMINCTPKKEVWGTGLYDRDPMPLRGKDQGSRVTVIGDACHPMSMFKGQGANQALHDGPLLASWLDCGAGATAKKNSRPHSNIFDAHKVIDNNLNAQNVYTRLRCFEREMVARTSSKVRGSRDAATKLHSPAAMTDTFGIEGVQSDATTTILKTLRELNVGAHLGSNLESKMLHVIDQLESDRLEELEKFRPYGGDPIYVGHQI